MRRVFLLIFIITAIGLCGLPAQTLPADRSTDWTLAGFKGNRNVDYPVVDFISEGGIPDGVTANDGVYDAILADLNGDPAIIYFAPGEYFFTSTIQLRSHLVLRGASSDETTFLFDLSGSGDLIHAGGSTTALVHFVTQPALNGEYHLELDDASGIETGDYIKLIEEDDTLVTSDWALYTSGQVVSVSSVSGNTISLNSPLRRSYLPGNDARIVKLVPDVNVGIENMKIIRQDATPVQTSNIKYEIVADSWVDCVSSFNSNFCHIDLRTCINVDVTGCYMQDAFAYGGGGQGYGVVLHSTTSECLVTDNRFKHLRHSMLLQSGANGNVVSYNYSTNPFWTEVGPLPSNSAGDLVLHGNWAYMNLFEGNDVAHMVIDDSHGRNGPYNTLFRNRAHLYGIFMNNLPASNMQNLIGNEVTNPNIIMGYYITSGSGHFQHGNNIRGQIIPAGTGNLPEASLYLDEAPDYYLDNNSWPPIGIPNQINSHDPKAEDIFNDGYLTTCEADIVVSAWEEELYNSSVLVYPLPSTSFIKVKSEKPGPQVSKLELCALNGKLIRSRQNSDQMHIGDLANGMYMLRITMNDGNSIAKKVVKVK